MCAAASLALLLIPRHETRAASQLLADTASRQDTLPLVQHAADTRVTVAAAESALAHARRLALAPRRPPDSAPVPAADTTPAGRAHRDTAAAEAAELDQLLTRVERSPLPSSYRALGGAAALAGVARVQVLLDSLSDVARARDAFDAAGGVDPIFVALTGRVNAIGHSIQSIAESRRTALRALIARSGPPAAPIVRPDNTDTLRLAARVDSAQRALDAIAVAFARARARDQDLDARAERARAITDQSASPLALAAAALVLGLALGFAMTFGAELRRPRVADAAEAARVAGVPALASITPRLADPARARRAADQALSPLIDASAEGYRVIYAALRDPQGTNPIAFPFVAVTGDEAAIVATVATNLAVTAINDFRSALLIDADPDAGLVAGIVSVPRQPGVADVLAGRSDWAAVTVSGIRGARPDTRCDSRRPARRTPALGRACDPGRRRARGITRRTAATWAPVRADRRGRAAGRPADGEPRYPAGLRGAHLRARGVHDTEPARQLGVGAAGFGTPRAWHRPVGRGFAAAGPAAAHFHLSSRRPCSLIACCSSNTIFFFASRSGRTSASSRAHCCSSGSRGATSDHRCSFTSRCRPRRGARSRWRWPAYQWHGLALRDLAGATRMDHLLWLTLGLDLGGVAVGATLAASGWRAGPPARARGCRTRDHCAGRRIPRAGWPIAGAASGARVANDRRRSQRTDLLHHRRDRRDRPRRRGGARAARGDAHPRCALRGRRRRPPARSANFTRDSSARSFRSTWRASRPCARRRLRCSASGRPIDVLINNAGRRAGRGGTTADGFDVTIETNHVGQFLLTEMLLPALTAAPQGRIVNVASRAHYARVAIPLGRAGETAADPGRPVHLRDVQADERAAREGTGAAARRHPRHDVFAAPGRGGLRVLARSPRPVQWLLKLRMISNEAGALTPLYCATAPELSTTSGRYYARCREAQPSRLAMDAGTGPRAVRPHRGGDPVRAP